MPNPGEIDFRLAELLSRIAGAQADSMNSEQQDKRLRALMAGYRKTVAWHEAGCPSPKGTDSRGEA